jgi:uncharacterized protein (TIGR01619 family)
MQNAIKPFYLLMVLFSSVSLYGQQDNWDVYMAQYEKGPASTVLNLSLKQSAPTKGFPFILIAAVTFKDCNKDGLPVEGQFAALYTISDSIKAIVDRNIKNILAGTFTYQCERSDYYYITDTSNIREALMKVNKKTFNNLSIRIKIKEDKNWDAYLKFLYPNEEILEYMSDSKVVQALAAKGDKLEKARKVDHWIYFDNEQDRDCFSNYATNNKFRIESKTKTDRRVKSYALQISRDDKVSLSDISQITNSLRQNAKKCNGDYDGWETFILTE